MKNTLIIIGASGHGKVAADIAIKMNRWKEIFFLDDDETVKECLRLPVIGKVEEAINYKKRTEFFVAIGNNLIREKIQEKLLNDDLEIVSLIHPSAVIGSEVEIGDGTVVMAGTVINSSSQIGKGCIINTSSSIDHDNTIKDYVHISPGVRTAGNVSIGKGTWLGIGSIISNNITVCERSISGAGTVIVNDLKELGTYIGNPARRINK